MRFLKNVCACTLLKYTVCTVDSMKKKTASNKKYFFNFFIII